MLTTDKNIPRKDAIRNGIIEWFKIASNAILFDPRQKGSPLDDMLAKDPHVEPMKYHKKKVRVKVKRVK